MNKLRNGIGKSKQGCARAQDGVCRSYHEEVSQVLLDAIEERSFVFPPYLSSVAIIVSKKQNLAVPTTSSLKIF